jgi:hypothetical protein
MARTTSSDSPDFLAKRPPIRAWVPSTSWSMALPTSCSSAARHLDVRPELLGHHASQVRYLDRVGEHVLAVGGAVLQRAQQPDQVPVHAPGDLGVVERLPSCRLHLLLDVLSGLGDDLLYAARVDPPVLHEPLHRDPRDLTPHGVEARDDDRLWRVVDDDVDAGRRLEGPDVAPLAPYDPSLHVVGRERYRLYGRLRGEVRGKPLHSRGDKTASFCVRLLLCLHCPLEHQAAHPVLQLRLQTGEKPPLGLLPRETGDLLQRPQLLSLSSPQLLLPRAQRLLCLRSAAPALVELALAPVQSGVAVVQPLLDARDLSPPRSHLGLGLVFDPQGSLFGFQLRFAALRLGSAVGVLDDRTRVRPGLGLTTPHS